MKNAIFLPTPIGEIGIAEENGAVTNVFFEQTVRPKEFVRKETPVLAEAAKQLNEYFEGKRQTFSLPLTPEGTPFEREVWNALLSISYGETSTYGEIAAALGRPGAARAVGRANSQNPVSIFIPCHRVIGKSGALTGYAGGLAAKTFLLTLEGVLPPTEVR